MALVPKCVSRAEKEGFVRENEAGTDGLTIGTMGDEDGVVTAVAARSAGAVAGVAADDRIVSVDAKPVRWTPAMEVAHQTFGERGKELTLTVKTVDGAERQVTFVRGRRRCHKARVRLDPDTTDAAGGLARTVCSVHGCSPMTAATNAICAKIFRPWGLCEGKGRGVRRLLCRSGAHGCSGGDDGGAEVRGGGEGRAYPVGAGCSRWTANTDWQRSRVQNEIG